MGVELVDQSNLIEQIVGEGFGLVARHSLDLGRAQNDVFEDVHVREEVKVLEHHAHLAPMRV